MSAGSNPLKTALAIAAACSCVHCGARSELLVPRDAASTEDANRCDGGTIAASIQITTDDNFRLYVNGSLIDDTPRVWSSPQRYSVDLSWGTSRNAIAVEGTNIMNVDGLDRGVLVDVRFNAAGIEHHVLSDAQWRLSRDAVSNWFRTDFDASGWPHAISEGTHGIAPWGPVFGSSDAQWIWSYVANQSAGSKPTHETIWLRREFYIDTSGRVVEQRPDC